MCPSRLKLWKKPTIRTSGGSVELEVWKTSSLQQISSDLPIHGENGKAIVESGDWTTGLLESGDVQANEKFDADIIPDRKRINTFFDFGDTASILYYLLNIRVLPAVSADTNTQLD